MSYALSLPISTITHARTLVTDGPVMANCLTVRCCLATADLIGVSESMSRKLAFSSERHSPIPGASKSAVRCHPLSWDFSYLAVRSVLRRRVL